MTDAPLARLEAWFEAMCDGDWEHAQRIRIENTDNPGWSITVDLTDSPRNPGQAGRVERERAEHDWVHVWTDGNRVRAACGPKNLGEALSLVLAVLDGAPQGS